jgi:hypothetical protein
MVKYPDLQAVVITMDTVRSTKQEVNDWTEGFKVKSQSLVHKPNHRLDTFLAQFEDRSMPVRIWKAANGR